MHIHELLVYCVKQGASDLHIAAGEVPSLRIHGEIQRLNAPPLPPDDCKRLLFSIMNERQKAEFEENLEADFSIGIRDLARFRVNLFYQGRGIGAVFRTIPSEILPLEKLNLPPVNARVAVAGIVILRQRPGTAKGVIFVTLEDETGVVNVIVWRHIYERFRRAVIAGRMLRVTGRLQRAHNVTHVLAEEIEDISALLDQLVQPAEG